MMEVKFNINDGIVKFIKSAGRKPPVMAGFAVLFFVAAMAVFAADIQVPHVFQSGDVISAAEINENFQVLQNRINQLAGEVKGVPIGTIVPYAGLDTNVPAGWRLCNGQELNRTEFAELFAVIGTLWGDGNSVTTFNVPDLRGLFLRGVNLGRNGIYADPDSANRVDYDGTTVGDRVGSFQDDAFQNHVHSILVPQGYNGRASEEGAWVGTQLGNTGNVNTGRVSTETRSANASVNYIIKIQ